MARSRKSSKSSRKTTRKSAKKSVKRRLPKQPTKRSSRLIKRVKYASGRKVTRPSARAVFDKDRRKRVHYAFYDGKMHVMKFRKNGSPYWALM